MLIVDFLLLEIIILLILVIILNHNRTPNLRDLNKQINVLKILKFFISFYLDFLNVSLIIQILQDNFYH